MKKRTSKKLALNKQKISELSNGNLEEIKGGGTYGITCGGGVSRYICPPTTGTDSYNFYDCSISARVCVEK